MRIVPDGLTKITASFAVTATGSGSTMYVFPPRLTALTTGRPQYRQLVFHKQGGTQPARDEPGGRTRSQRLKAIPPDEDLKGPQMNWRLGHNEIEGPRVGAVVSWLATPFIPPPVLAAHPRTGKLRRPACGSPTLCDNARCIFQSHLRLTEEESYDG
jgi:hypothetical protein